jgi:hypothetical protein
MRPRLPRHLLQPRPWRSVEGRRRHRQLDRQADAALDLDRDGGRPPTPTAMEELRMTYERKPRVLFMELEQRISERTGRAWFSSWLGKCRVVGFVDEEPNARGNKVVRVFLEEAEPRPAPQHALASTAAAMPVRPR